MKKRIPLYIAMLIAYLALSAASAQALFSTYAPLAGNVALETALTTATNSIRAANGASQLAYSEELALAARQHALEMATLGYFSHSSPTPNSHTPSERAARAGFPFVKVGENIARMPGDNVIQAVMAGWMDSPGHRENILYPQFSHVGFGTAIDSRGQTVVVQMFGYQPYRLVSARLTPKQQNEYTLSVEVITPQGGNFILYYGDRATEPMFLQPGSHILQLTTAEAEQLHIQLAILSPAGDGFILQDSGWLKPATNSFASDELAPRTYGSILTAGAALQTVDVTEVNLVFDGAAQKELAVFVDDIYIPGAATYGAVTVLVSATSLEPEIVIGELTSDNQVDVTMLLTIDRSQGQPALAAKAVE